MDVKLPNTCTSLTHPKTRDSKKVGGKEKKKQSERKRESVQNWPDHCQTSEGPRLIYKQIKHYICLVFLILSTD